MIRNIHIYMTSKEERRIYIGYTYERVHEEMKGIYKGYEHLHIYTIRLSRNVGRGLSNI